MPLAAARLARTALGKLEPGTIVDDAIMEILPSVEKALGDYYRAHQDVGTQGFASRRLLTFVHYLHRTPRPFEGGALRVYDGATSMHDGGRPLTREDRAWQDWGPDHDSIVFFLPDK
ncbi:2OG-Fe(II) oxygenase [Streptomyces manipurensis]|uniref:2OG-Fe(II) oxygenase n=1 Tax=Streptomyces manipurensis TaxID=1077945 RepID=UPI003C704D14